MTEEEIKKFAKEYVQNNTDESVNSFIGEQLQKAFIEGTDFMYYSNNEELKKELTEKDKQIAELKRDKSELCNAINEEGKACVKLNEKLSKAKGFIEKLLIVSCNSEILIQYPNCKEVLEARVALEQFLMEK